MADQADVSPFTDDSAGTPAVRGFLHRPAESTGDALVLTHGAGSNCQAPLLRNIASAFAQQGLTVLRCDLAFRQARLHGPPIGTSKEDREGLRNAANTVRKLTAGRVLLGGHSYGGRQASMLAAEDQTAADGLLLLSYPLHPPRRPEQLRTAHLPKLKTRALFVHGSRDPFGSPAEVEAALKLIPAPTQLVVIEGAGHELGPGPGKQIDDHHLAERVWEASRNFFGF